MSTVYIIEQWATLHRSDQHLVVMKGEQKIKQLPLFHIDSLLIYGEVQLTSKARTLLLTEGIETGFFSLHGKYYGRLQPFKSKNVLLRVAQYERFHDQNFKLEFSRTIIKAKLRNARSLIMRYQRNYPEQSFACEIELIEQNLKKLEQANTINSIMGLEGSGTAAYFRAFGQMFRRDLAFTTRTRRPPKDPVNAVLSLGYTLITNEIFHLLEAIGFDPYLGFMHTIDYGRASLALDLVEEFRQPLIDRFTLNLFNNQILKETDFRPVEGEGIYLKEEALKTYFKMYALRLQEKFQPDKNDAAETTFRELVRRQLDRLSKTLLFNEPYQPFRLRD
jgi:CRISPR-associated protein Cas1